MARLPLAWMCVSSLVCLALLSSCTNDYDALVLEPGGDAEGTNTDASTADGGAGREAGGGQGGSANVDGPVESAADSASDSRDSQTDTQAEVTDVTFIYDAPECKSGCDGGVCINGSCCDWKHACDKTCCADGLVCSFQKCQAPGAVCIDASECPADSYCEYSLGEPAGADSGAHDAGTCQAGVIPATGRCLPKPPQCPAGIEPAPGEPITCLPACEHKPDPSSFSPVLKYHWSGGNIMMTPVVIQLDDDSCDGVVDERDIPDLVFLTFDGIDYEHKGTLRAISVHDGKVTEKWSLKPTTNPFHPGRSIAAGNIDGKPGNEIVVCTDGGKVSAVTADGKVLWTDPGGGCVMPSIGDVDGDGKPEVVEQGRIINGADGKVTRPLNPPALGNVILSDMDGDGKLDVVSPVGIWGGDGLQKAHSDIAGTHVAIGDFDKDGLPDVASINTPTHTLSVWRYDSTAANGVKVLRTGIDINGTAPNVCPSNSSGYTTGGGPPTIADFNGDGTPDVAVAGGIGYAVIDGTKVLDPKVPPNQTNLWLKETHDCSSASSGSSLFDFEGDGLAEVVYSDEHYLRVYRGTDGNVLFQTCNTTGTLLEYPLVADVDADGQADLVVVSNNYSNITCPDDGSKQKGLRVFSAMGGQWVRTRRIWNQHAYHVTNVEEDGTIPTAEPPNWLQPGLNNFRQNVQPKGQFSAPDLIVSVEVPPCGVDYALVARVRNIGEASVPAGVLVGFYMNDPAAGGTLLGTANTTLPLYPAEAEDVRLPLSDPPSAVTDGISPVYAVVDDGQPQHAWVECRVGNNKSSAGTGRCQGGPH